MNRKLTMMLMLVFVLIAGSAISREVATVTRIGDAPIESYGYSSGRSEMVGNLNDAAFLIPGWFWGDEEYKYLFDPTLQVACEEGFLLETVHMIVDFDENMVPITFDVWSDLEDANWDEATQCWVPGIEDCVSEIITITIETAGTYDIAVPIDCQCAYMTYPNGVTPYMYLLSMHFIGLFDMNLVTDEFPTPCTNYNNWGDGWYDLFGSFAEYGNIVMYGDVTCCGEPVAVEKSTLDGVKSLYR